MVISSLFLLVNHTVKVIVTTLSLFNMDHLCFGKSVILIFIFAENNYSIYAHTMLIKTHLLHQSFGPHVLLSLSVSLRLILWSAEMHHAHSPAQASKTLSRRRTVPSPPREGAQCLHEAVQALCQELYWFSV